ncbi:MAG: hypothetical protein LBG43_05090 [Treponema sp.]|jgi:hypothetical protein|nr:hypothetical protein [Treponema sp.]
MNKVAPIISFIFLTGFTYGQDCCGPGGGGSGSGMDITAITGSGGYVYRLKNARHYAYSARRPGFTTGIEGGGIPDSGNAAISPRLEYANSFGSFDVYGGIFYSVFFEKPHSHQADFSENIAWHFAPDKNSRLVLRLDNEDLIVFFPDEVQFAYAALDPSVSYSRAFGFGDLSLSTGFPVLIKPESGLNSWFSLGYEHPIGLGLTVCPRFSLVPGAQYNGIAFTLNFAWDSFFAKASFVVNEDFSSLDLRPYAEFTMGHIVLWAGAEFSHLGRDDVSVSPFIGTAYHF